MDSAKNSVSKNEKPAIKRRKFFFLFGAAAVGVMALSKSPLKLIGSAFGGGSAAQGTAGAVEKKAEKNRVSSNRITVKENPFAVRRELKKDTGSRLNG